MRHLLQRYAATQRLAEFQVAQMRLFWQLDYKRGTRENRTPTSLRVFDEMYEGDIDPAIDGWINGPDVCRKTP